MNQERGELEATPGLELEDWPKAGRALSGQAVTMLVGSAPERVGLREAGKQKPASRASAVTSRGRGLRSSRCTVDDRAPFSGRV